MSEDKIEDKYIEILGGALAEALSEAIRLASRTYGAVHKAVPAVISEEKGFLIWDYILFNELTFLNSETKEITSLFTSFSDEEMENRFNEFAMKYGTL